MCLLLHVYLSGLCCARPVLGPVWGQFGSFCYSFLIHQISRFGAFLTSLFTFAQQLMQFSKQFVQTAKLS